MLDEIDYGFNLTLVECKYDLEKRDYTVVWCFNLTLVECKYATNKS